MLGLLSLAPMPDSSNMWGVCTVPHEMITPLVAWTRCQFVTLGDPLYRARRLVMYTSILTQGFFNDIGLYAFHSSTSNSKAYGKRVLIYTSCCIAVCLLVCMGCRFRTGLLLLESNMRVTRFKLIVPSTDIFRQIPIV